MGGEGNGVRGKGEGGRGVAWLHCVLALTKVARACGCVWRLQDGDRVLISEACNHNRITSACNDIGMVQVGGHLQACVRTCVRACVRVANMHLLRLDLRLDTSLASSL